MKIRYPVIATLVILIAISVLKSVHIIMDDGWYHLLTNILGILFVACLGLIIYLMVRNIFRAVKGIITKPKEGR